MGGSIQKRCLIRGIIEEDQFPSLYAFNFFVLIQITRQISPYRIQTSGIDSFFCGYFANGILKTALFSKFLIIQLHAFQTWYFIA